MPKKVNVTVTGLEDVLKKINAITGNIQEPLAQAIYKGGEVVAAVARIKAVQQDIFDTGFLANSIASSEPYGNETRQSVDVGSAADYDIYTEFGTATMPARPHLRPAFDENQETVAVVVLESVKDYLKDLTE